MTATTIKKVAILGAGGFARETLWVFREANKEKKEWEQVLLTRDNEVANLKTSLANLDASLKSELTKKETERESMETALKADLERVMARLDLEKVGLDTADLGKLHSIKTEHSNASAVVEPSPDVSPLPEDSSESNPQ